MKIVTYKGKAGRYYVRDKAGTRHRFPRGVPVEVSDEVAALVPSKNEDLKVEDAPTGDGAVEDAPTGDGGHKPTEAEMAEHEATKRRGRASRAGSSEESK